MLLFSQCGTGLAIAIAKHILNRHEGKLEIASTPGEGSAFTVWLPAASETAASGTASDGEAARRSA